MINRDLLCLLIIMSISAGSIEIAFSQTKPNQAEIPTNTQIDERPLYKGGNTPEKLDFGPYMADLQPRIKKVWKSPRLRRSAEGIVGFKVHSDGHVTHLKLVKSFGSAAADKAALEAVKNASPLRPLPLGAPKDVDIQFSFSYNNKEGDLKWELAQLQQHQTKNADRIADILYILGGMALDEQRYQQAETSLKQCVAILDDKPDSEKLASALQRLANCYGYQNKPGKAKPLLERSLVITKRINGTDDSKVAHVLKNLAACSFHMRDYNSGNQYLQDAVEIGLKQLPPDDVGIYDILQVGTEYFQTDKLEPLYKRVLAVHEQKLPAQHPFIARDLTNLAACYFAQVGPTDTTQKTLDKYTNAQALLERALKIEESEQPKDTSNLASTLVMLGKCQYMRGDCQQGLERLRRALILREQDWGTEDDTVQQHRDHLVEFYARRGDISSIENLYLEALSAAEAGKAADDASQFNCLDRMGRFYFQLKDYSKAASFFERKLRHQEKILGLLDPETAETRKKLFDVFRVSKRNNPEILYEELVRQINKEGVGSDDLANSLEYLAWCYNCLHRYKDAETTLLRSLNLRMQAKNANEIAVAVNIFNLALTCERLGKTAESEKYFKLLLRNCKALPGKRELNELCATEQLSSFYWRHKNFTLAERLILREGTLEAASSIDSWRRGRAFYRKIEFYRSSGNYPVVETLLKLELQSVKDPVWEHEQDTLSQLADLYMESHRESLVEPLYFSEIARWKKKGSKPTRITLGLVDFYCQTSQFDKADKLLRKCLIEEPSMSWRGDQLAYICYKLGRYQESESIYRHNLQSWTVGKDPDEHTILNGIPNNRLPDSRIRGVSCSIGAHVLHPEFCIQAMYRTKNGVERIVPEFNSSPFQKDAAPEILAVMPPIHSKGWHQQMDFYGKEEFCSESVANAYVQLQLANCLRGQEKYDSAESLYKKAIEISKQDLTNLETDSADAVQQKRVLKNALTDYAALLRKLNREGESKQFENESKGLN